MSKHPIRSWALSALACLQVLLASGDDFNLARFLFPPAESESEDLLPLDDPNFDFTKPSETPVPGNSGHGTGANPAPIPLCPARMSHALLPASGVPGRLTCACPHTPLRC
jgi:hypothetical protein